ncbi:MAG TPA: hypothetical protein VFW19_00770 [Allosphingosinicella sp.]|nr:hypothetical protein [Allosphingosinicella sp.]
MAKSSKAVAMLLAGWSTGAAAQSPPAGPVTADVAMARYEQWLHGSGTAGCAASGNASDADIVVCGRRSRQAGPRLPLPIERDPGEVVRHINEPGNAVAAMNGPVCMHSCERPVTINPIQVIFAVPKVIRHLLHGDD